MTSKLDPSDIAAVLGGMLGAMEGESKDAFAAFSETPAAQAAIAAIRAGDTKRFYFAWQYPVSRVIDGLLATEFPGKSQDIRFLFRESQFVEGHIRGLIEKFEGGACAADKTRTVMRTILRYLKTGKEIGYDYGQEYTFHLPQRVLTDHQTTLDYFKALQSLCYGRPEPFFHAYLAVQNKLRNEAIAEESSQSTEASAPNPQEP